MDNVLLNFIAYCSRFVKLLKLCINYIRNYADLIYSLVPRRSQKKRRPGNYCLRMR